MLLKKAVVHLHTGVELILKEAIFAEHWALVFKDTRQATQEKLRTGDFESIGYNDLIRVFSNLTGKEVAKKSILDDLGKNRNKVAHFGYDLDEDDISRIFYGSLSFLIDYVSDESRLHGDWSAEIEDLKLKTAEIRAFIEHRRSEIKTEKQGVLAVLPCPYCRELGMTIDGDTCECRLCRCTAENQVLFEEFTSRFLDVPFRAKHAYLWYQENVSCCPECHEEMFVEITALKESNERFSEIPNWICFGCGLVEYQVAIGYCGRCGEPIFDPEQGAICSDCFRDICEKD